MSITSSKYEGDNYTTYTVQGEGVGPYTYLTNDGEVLFTEDRKDSLTTHRQNYMIAGGKYGEVTVMVLGTLATSEGQEKGYVHAKFTAQQAREIAEVLLTVAREFEEGPQPEQESTFLSNDLQEV